MEQDADEKKRLLVKYLKKHLSKKTIKMRNVFYSIKKQLEEGEHITYRQFNAIVPYVEREATFRSKSRKEVIAYFSDLITGNNKEDLNDAKNPTYEFIKNDHFQCAIIFGEQL